MIARGIRVALLCLLLCGDLLHDFYVFQLHSKWFIYLEAASEGEMEQRSV